MKTNLRSIALATIMLSACGGGGSGSGNGTVTANVKSLSSGKLEAELNKGMPFAIVGHRYGAAAVGAGGLESFKMYISSIQFCESLDIEGSGYNNPTNCTTVYENSDDDYDSFDVAAAADAGSDKYFDLLTDSGRDALTASTKMDPGTYNYGLINWYRPIKFTATVPLAHGMGSLYTKECPSTGDCIVTGMATAPAEESIVDFNNGGTWMKFLKPLVVTGDEDFTVDLAFDLEQRVFGGKDISNGQIREETGCTAMGSDYCGIYMPILRLMPVAHTSEESTIVETYEMGGASTEWNVRVDVYYNSGDPDKTVLAADIYPVPTDLVDHSVAAGVYVYSVSDDDGVITFKDVDGHAQLSDFTRGESGTAKLTCPSGAELAECTAGSKVDVSWSVRSVRTL